MISRRSHQARERAGVAGRADRRGEVGALDAALEPEDEGEAPDHERGADDQDAGLAQRLAEEAEDPPAEDLAEHTRAELADLAEEPDPVP